jgi:hypothetical protein
MLRFAIVFVLLVMTAAWWDREMCYRAVDSAARGAAAVERGVRGLVKPLDAIVDG